MKKWRLLASVFTEEGFRSRLFESASWTGPFREIARETKLDSTGTQIVQMGDNRFIFSGCDRIPGGDAGGVIAMTYPDMKYLGVMNFDLSVTKAGGRVWPNIVPLPAGYPTRFIAIPMDRVKVPDVSKQNWSYGALYLFQADPGN